MVRPTRMVLLVGSVGVLGAVALTGSNILSRAREAAQVEALRLGGHAGALAQLELQARLREIEARAATAASLNPVRALASQRVDERTLRDAFETEAWWRSFRDEFPVQLLLLGPERYEFGRKDLGSALRTDALVRDAMQRSPASGALRVEDTVLLVSVAAVDVPVDPTRRPAIVVLAQPLTARDLARVAGRAGGAVAVTGPDHRLLVMSGSAEEEQRLRDLLARPVPVLEGAIASAGSAPLGEGLTLWASADTRLASDGARRPAQTVVAVLWLLGLAACAVLVAGALRRPRNEHVQLEATREEPQRTRAELERRPVDAQAVLGTTQRTTRAELERRPVDAQAVLETTREEPQRTRGAVEQRPVEAQAALETTREEPQRTRAAVEQRPVEAQAALETTREELQRMRAELEQRAADEQALLEATREELQRTRAELERGPDEHMLLEATREELHRTRTELERRPDEHMLLEATREELQRTRAELERRPDEHLLLEATREELQRTRAELERRAADEQALLEATREELQRTRARLERGPDEHILLEATREELQRTRSDLERRAADEQALLEATREELQRTRAELERRPDEQALLETTREELQRTRSELERRAADEQALLEATREELQRTRAKLERRPDEQALLLEAPRAPDYQRLLGGTRAVVQRTRAELEQRAADEQALLEATREELRRTRTELERGPDEHILLEATREELQRTRTELERRAADEQALLGATREELQRTRTELERRAAEEQALLEATREELQRTRAELDRGPDEHMLLEATRGELQRTRTELERRVADEQALLEATREELRRTRAELERGPDEHTLLEATRGELQRTRSELERRAADEQALLEATREELERTRAELDRRGAGQHELEATREKLQRTRAELDRRRPPDPVPLAPTPLANPSPTQFGRYRLLHVLGQGERTTVHLAVSHGVEGPRRFLAVKRLHEDLARMPQVVSHFLEEARLGTSLIHSNIVPILDFGRVGNEYFLAEEYVLGRDLNFLLHRARHQGARGLPLPAVLYLAQEILDALAYAHSWVDRSGRPLKILHRDISPMKVMVSRVGEVKLFDFGIARDDRTEGMTEAGRPTGNVLFMSPEQARGLPIDARSDLFSLGLTVYHCLAGEPLYPQDGSDEDLLVRAAQGPGPVERDRIARLPAAATVLLSRALQVDPAERFQTADEFLVGLPGFSLAGGAAALLEAVERLVGTDLASEEARFAQLGLSDESSDAPASERTSEPGRTPAQFVVPPVELHR